MKQTVTSRSIACTDDEIVSRLQTRFDVLRAMTTALKEEALRALIVVGPPGLGKSYTVEDALKQASVADMLRGEVKYEVMRGSISPLGMYKSLYHHRERNSVIVFDDCDASLKDTLVLDLLKVALDTTKNRVVQWNTNSRVLEKEGIPNSFLFEGGCVVITNIKFERTRGQVGDHLAAVQDRSHYIDLEIDTIREKLVWCKHLIYNCNMLAHHRFEPVQIDQIYEFMVEHQHKLREVSLRTAIKIADLCKVFPQHWRETALVTVVKGG